MLIVNLTNLQQLIDKPLIGTKMIHGNNDHCNILYKDVKLVGPPRGNREMLKTTLRAMIAINKIEDIRAISRKWNDFMEKSKKNPKLVELFHSFENENLDG
jgi:hypothetical protein